MAQRIKLGVLSGDLAPYSSLNLAIPVLPSGLVSEYLSYDVDQLQRNHDTTPATRASYPNAMSVIVIKDIDQNHFKADTFFINQTQDQVNTLANS